MPDPNQNQPVNQPIDTSAQPAAPVTVPVHTDLPPLPDFMNTTPTTPQPVTQPEVPDTSVGSASPPDLPPMIATPKKKFGGGKIVATILGILLLVGGVGAGIYLTQQPQIFNQKAADTATESGSVQIPEATDIHLDEIASTSATTTPNPTESPVSSSARPPTNTVAGVDNGSGTITLTMPKMSPNCQFGKLDNASATNSCLAARQYDSGTFSIPTGCTATGIAITSSSLKYDDYLFLVMDGKVISGHEKMGLVGKTWDWDALKKVTCSGSDGAKITPYVCNNATTCTVSKSEDTGNMNIVYDQTNVSSILASGASHTFLVVAGGDKDSESDCYTSKDIQFKLTYSCNGPTPTPTAPPGAPQCLSVKAYDAAWKVLSDSDLSGLLTGTHIKFCVASSGTADKAQFKINSTLLPETTSLRPSSTDFCQDYTILSTDTTVGVKAKIHYPSQGWYGENI